MDTPHIEFDDELPLNLELDEMLQSGRTSGEHDGTAFQTAEEVGELSNPHCGNQGRELLTESEVFYGWE